ncbi:MAG: type II secretion system protein GspK [Minicystis sp.]
MSARRKTPRKRRADQRGIALILVLGSITLLTVFLTQLQEQTSSELAAALAERDALKAEYYARSGINLSRLLIAMEPEIRSTVKKSVIGMLFPKGNVPQIPVWEFTDLVLGPFNDAVGSQSFLATIGADPLTAKNIGIQGGGRFEIVVVDEDAKINLNIPAQNSFDANERLGRLLLGVFAPQANNSLFEQPDSDNQHSDREAICGALVDWVDSDPAGNEEIYPCQPNNQNRVNTGAEDNFYQMIGLPYRRKNAAFDSLDEARLVRGMGDDIWATFVDPEPNNPKKRVMTVWGQGEININAANPQTLLSIVCGEEPLAELCNDPQQMVAFLGAVEMGKSFTMGMPIFGSGKDFVETMKGGGQLGPLFQTLNIKPVNFRNANQLAKRLRTSSKRFSVYADGVVPGYKRTTKVRIHAVIDFRDAGALGPMAPPVVGGGMAAAAAAMAPAAPTLQGGQAGQTLTGTAGTSAGATAGAGSTNGQPLSADAILAAMNSNPAGTIVYWRVE